MTTRFDPVFAPLAIPDVVLVSPKQIGDARGLFRETYSKAAYQAGGVDADFVQDNHSISATRGTVRGLHFQRPPFAQAKLVRCLKGSVFDVAVDLRRGSPTYGAHVSATLSAETGDQLYVPAGFAHGFCTLEDECEIAYKVSAYYDAASDAGLAWDDPDLGVDWPVDASAAILSDKDKALPAFRGFDTPFDDAG